MTEVLRKEMNIDFNGFSILEVSLMYNMEDSYRRPRGYYASVNVVKLIDRENYTVRQYESLGENMGYKMLLNPVRRSSKKALAEAEKILESQMPSIKADALNRWKGLQFKN